MANTAPQPLATPSQVAEWLQESEGYLAKLRSAGTGPAFIKTGRKVRYAWKDVHDWCTSNRATKTR